MFYCFAFDVWVFVEEKVHDFTFNAPETLHKSPISSAHLSHLCVQGLVHLPHIGVWLCLLKCWQFIDVQHLQNRFVKVSVLQFLPWIIHWQETVKPTYS